MRAIRPFVLAVLVLPLVLACGQGGGGDAVDAGHRVGFLGPGPGPGGSSCVHDGTLTGNCSPGAPLKLSGVSPPATTVQQFAGTVIRPAALTGAVDDWAPAGLSTATTIIVGTSGATTLSGITGGIDGRRLELCNTGTFAMTLVNDSVSTAANRFLMPDALAWTLGATGQSCMSFTYDGTAARWKPISKTGSTFPSLTVTGPSTVGQINGTVQTTTVTGTQDDFALTATTTVLRINGASGSTFDGLTGGVDGRMLFIENLGTSQVTLATEAGGSTAANRILGFNNQNVTLATNATNPNSGATLIYDGTTSRWRVINVGTTAVNTTTAFANGLSSQGTTTISAIFTANNNFRLNSTQSPTALSGSTNDYNPTNLSITNTLRQDVSAAATLTGLTAQGTGTIITITNIATTAGLTLTFTNEDAASSAANRFTLLSAVPLVLDPGGSITFRYDGTSSRWRPINQVYGLTLVTQADTSTGTQNDFVVNTDTQVLRANPASSLTYTGFKCGGADCTAANGGRVLYVESVGAGNVTLTQEGAGSVAGNRIFASTANNASLPAGGTNPNTGATLIYDGTSLRWRIVSLNTSTWVASQTFSGTITANGAVLLSNGTNHIRSTGTAVVPSTCGTSPTVNASTDIAGAITIGGTGTACTIPFGATYTNKPSCVVSFEQSITWSYTVSATQIVVTAAAGAGDTFHYHCTGLI